MRVHVDRNRAIAQSRMEQALVLAPGSAVTRLGLSGSATPAATLPSARVPLTSAPAFASALLLAAASSLSLPRTSVSSRELIVVAHPAAVVAHAALALLGMRAVLFVPAHVAVAAVAARDGPCLVLDVGWEASRASVGFVERIADVGVRHVADFLRERDVVADDMDEVRVKACLVGASDTVNDAVDGSGRVVVPGALRAGAAEVLFDRESGTYVFSTA